MIVVSFPSSLQSPRGAAVSPTETNLSNPFSNDTQLGYSVSVSENIVIVGAPLDDTQGLDTGAAVIFEKDLGGIDNWGERMILFASNANASTQPLFGFSVAMSSSGHAIVGVHLEDTQAMNAGAAYIFEKDLDGVDDWGERTTLFAVMPMQVLHLSLDGLLPYPPVDMLLLVLLMKTHKP